MAEFPVFHHVMPTALTRLIDRLSAPVDGRQIAWLRIFFGAVMLYEPVAIMRRGDVRIFSNEIDHFSYYGFGWVSALPQSWTHALFVLLALAAMGVMLGLAYRASAITVAVIWTYVFLLEKTFFLNHWYLLAILSWLFVFVPASRELSVDNVIFGRAARTTTPAWALRAFQFQLIVVYVYAGLAKLTPDWLRGDTMRAFLSNKGPFPLIGEVTGNLALHQAMGVGAAIFDLSVAFLLFWKPARVPALAVMAGFHLANANLFHVGLFPHVALVASFILLRPDDVRLPAPWRTAKEAAASASRPLPRALKNAGFALLGLHVMFQLLFPLRHHLYEGPVIWTNEGYVFAWHMLAASRWVGKAEFVIVNKDTGDVGTFLPENVLIPQQTPDVYLDPDLILQIVERLEAVLADAGAANVAIHAGVPVSLNGGPFVPYVNPNVDLANVERGIGHKTWIVDREAWLLENPDAPLPEDVLIPLE